MSRKTNQAPDWPTIIAAIIATGMTESDISRAPGVGVSIKAIRYLAGGVQPLYHRGSALVDLWCIRTGLARETLPLIDLVRGHRKARGAPDLSPKMANAQLLMEALKPPVQQVKQQGAKRKVVA